MATSVVGLDIGHGVLRAAEVSNGSTAKPRLLRYHEVTFPADATREGEVVEPDVLVRALKQLWAAGKFRNPPQVDLETWHIPGGCAGAALYTFLQPGIYAYVNHNLIEAVELGATAHFKVEGEWNDDLITQVQAPTPIG